MKHPREREPGILLRPATRDAWGVIRGFVYRKVDLTILRWLGLVSNQSLELEKGEDIDLISQSLQSRDSIRAFRAD